MLDPTFAAAGSFYRGNLHTHSNRSDGALDPKEVCRRYRDEGYDFLALTDHFVGPFKYPITDTTGFRDNQFTTILGAELHSGAMQNGELWHILAVGLPDDFTPSNTPVFTPIEDQETGPEIAKRARDAGAFVAIAHPEWSGLTMEDARSIEAAHAVEIYNHGCDVDCDRGRGFQTLDLLLSEGNRLSLCATDDAHFKSEDYFGGWVMVKAQENEPNQLLQSLKDGRYYASQGPELHAIEWTQNEVTIECSAVKTIIVQGTGSRTETENGQSLTKATLNTSVLSHSDWLRVTIIDNAGRRAWSNPIWRDQIT